MTIYKVYQKLFILCLSFFYIYVKSICVSTGVFSAYKLKDLRPLLVQPLKTNEQVDPLRRGARCQVGATQVQGICDSFFYIQASVLKDEDHPVAQGDDLVLAAGLVLCDEGCGGGVGENEPCCLLTAHAKARFDSVRELIVKSGVLGTDVAQVVLSQFVDDAAQVAIGQEGTSVTLP